MAATLTTPPVVGEALNDGAFHPIAGVWLDTGLCDLAPGVVAAVAPGSWTRSSWSGPCRTRCARSTPSPCGGTR